MLRSVARKHAMQNHTAVTVINDVKRIGTHVDVARISCCVADVEEGRRFRSLGGDGGALVFGVPRDLVTYVSLVRRMTTISY